LWTKEEKEEAEEIAAASKTAVSVPAFLPCVLQQIPDAISPGKLSGNLETAGLQIDITSIHAIATHTSHNHYTHPHKLNR
jgi:hypothetical protein